MGMNFAGFPELFYGGDYNPEQWLDNPEILEKDIAYMKEAHINVVSLGIFAWSALEPEEGNFTFDWMEERIDTLYKNGISVFLSTPSGGRPKWMADKYQEVLRVDSSRHRDLYGLRHNHCYTSPVYREKVRRINQELAKRFGNHPAVLAWHISNEFGGECHCPLCQEKFREWLKERYGTIHELNKCWYTTFWSHTYQSFEQIESPSVRGETALHGLTLDWKRFVTDRTVDFVKAEINAVREVGSDKPATINMMYNFEGLNYHKFAEVVDFVTWDSYPTWHKGNEYLTAMDNAMQHDIMRSIKRKPFLLMESCPSSTNWQSVSKLKRPGMLEAASLQAIAHGSDSVLYFQIRQSRGSSEKFHGAVIDHYGGTDTRVFQEVKATGENLNVLSEVCGTNVDSKVAVIYDWENRWAMENAAGPRNKGLYYKETVEKSYFAFKKLGMNVDVIDMEQALEPYKVVVAPMLYMFRAGFEENVKEFVEQGGILIMTYWSGIVDESDLCFLEGTPHGLMDVMGLRREEIDGLYDGEYNTIAPADNSYSGLNKKYSCEHLCDLVKTSTAETLMKYEEDFYAGYPALTCNSYGKGKAYYICADMEQGFYDDFYQVVVAENNIPTILGEVKVPQGVAVSSRESEEFIYIFIQNFNLNEVEMEQPMDCEWTLGSEGQKIKGLETVVLRRRK
ncbi:beta-galactosidase [Anaerosporobacter sp.]|uniref:beta-galactosidase n=1 Tax=Anaerosporobacter sp. TaxID=1872529 RepID=UPI00286F4C5F|nr:beta-galactosidase [Anaerosporobacter sp.]